LTILTIMRWRIQICGIRT